MPGPSRGRGGSARGRGGRGRGGRGGGRGRGGHGGSRGRGGRPAPYPVTPAATQNTEDDVSTEETLNIETELKGFFVGTASFDNHFDAQESNKPRYVAGMTVLNKNGVEISQNARVRALAAAWARKDHDLAGVFLKDKDQFGLVEVLKALSLLDSARCIRVEEKKLKRLQLQSGGKIKSTVMGKFKSNVDNLTKQRPKTGSASGAICKRLRHWAKTFSAEELEFYALHYPAEPWKKLADICHFNPKKDFNLPWFLPYCFGESAPEYSMVSHCKNMTAETVNSLVKEFDVPFTHIKPFKDSLTEQAKAKVAATDLIDKVIWAYEDLQCSEVDEVLTERFQNGENLDLPYGKLMERLLTIKMIREEMKTTHSWARYSDDVSRNPNPTKAQFFPLLIPIAEKRLKDISLPLEPPIVVIGDKSSSMDVAIRTSTIIASLLTAITSAKLVFFNNHNEDAKFIPTNIEEVLEMAVTTQASGSTAPAASLYPFYEKKEVVKTFIMVTDEEENTACEGYKFLELFKLYREEVYPSRLVFVSFLRSQHAPGQMVSQLERSQVPVMQFKFDQARPDLTKLDTLFGLLSSESGSFEQQVADVELDIKTHGIQKIFAGLKLEEGNVDQKSQSVKTPNVDVEQGEKQSVVLDQGESEDVVADQEKMHNVVLDQEKMHEMVVFQRKSENVDQQKTEEVVADQGKDKSVSETEPECEVQEEQGSNDNCSVN